MKYCANCGASIGDEANFCPYCGTTVVKAAPVAPTPPPAPVPTQPPKKPKKGRIVALWTSIIAVVLILSIVIGCSFGLFDDLFYGSSYTMRDRDDDDDDDDDDRNDSYKDDTDPTIETTLPEVTLPSDVTLPTTPDSQGADITIKVWTPTEDQAEGSNWLEAMEAAFKAKYPSYSKVKFQNSTMGEGDAGTAVIADVTAAADVFMFTNDQLGKLVKAGGLTKITGNIAAQVKADNNDFMISTVTYTDGALYGFPVTGNTWFMYYDKTVFSEEDVKNLDTMLTKGKVYLPFGTGWTAGCIFLGCGGTIFGENGNNASAGIDFGGYNGLHGC